MTITPAQARHIMAYWLPVRHHEEFEQSVGNAEKCVYPDVLRSGGIRPGDLENESGGVYVGMDDYAGHDRVYTFDVKQTEKRAGMTVAEFEEYKKSVVEMKI